MPSILKFKTPSQVLLQAFPHNKILSSLDPKVFGCSVFVHIHPHHRNKLDPKSIKCIFLGYSPHQRVQVLFSHQQKVLYLNGCHILWTSSLLPQVWYSGGEQARISELRYKFWYTSHGRYPTESFASLESFSSNYSLRSTNSSSKSAHSTSPN
jgi:hypothetical protein